MDLLGEAWHQAAAAARFLVGEDTKDLGAGHMAVRSVVVYAGTLALVHLGQKRFLGRSSAFDFLVALMMGSVMSRAINAGAPLIPTFAAGGALVGMHWLLAALSMRSQRFAFLFKGRPRLLVRDGKPIEEEMRRHHIGQHDLHEAMRSGGKITRVEQIAEAHLERNGNISIIPRKERPEGPRVVEVRVEDGVQTVRLEIE